MHCSVPTGNKVLSFHGFCWAHAKFKMDNLFNMKCKVETGRYPNLSLMPIGTLK